MKRMKKGDLDLLNLFDPVDLESEYIQLVAAELICKRMKEVGIDQKELAKRAGVDPAQLSRLIKGTANFTIKSLVKYLYHMDVQLVLSMKDLRVVKHKSPR